MTIKSTASQLQFFAKLVVDIRSGSVFIMQHIPSRQIGQMISPTHSTRHSPAYLKTPPKTWSIIVCIYGCELLSKLFTATSCMPFLVSFVLCYQRSIRNQWGSLFLERLFLSIHVGRLFNERRTCCWIEIWAAVLKSRMAEYQLLQISDSLASERVWWPLRRL